MKQIHGRVVDALWNTGLPEIHLPSIGTELTWGLQTLDRDLGKPQRGHVVLVTGNRRSGTTSLVRSIALANAEQGHQVSFYVSDHDSAHETKHLVSAAIGTDIVSEESSGTGPEYGSFVPISDISGCIRVYDDRPSVLPHESMAYIPDVLICDEIDGYLDIHDGWVNRGIVLEQLRDFARRNNCLVVAVSKDYDDFDTDYAYMAEGWEFHVDTHLDIFRDDFPEPEDQVEGRIKVNVVRHVGRWSRNAIYLADQRSIGRLGDVENDSAVDELLSLLASEQPSPAEGQPPEIDDDAFEAVVNSRLRKTLLTDPAKFLRIFKLTDAFTLQGGRPAR